MPSAENRAWTVLLSDALYRRLLVLYPKPFRSAYGAAMVQLFRDRLRDQYRTRGDIGVLTLWPAALRDLMIAATAEHMVRERHMARKIVALVGGLALLIIGALAIALPQALYGLIGIVEGVLNVVAYLPVVNLLLVVYSLVHSLPLALILATLAFQFCMLLLWQQQTGLHQPAAAHHGEPQTLASEQRDLNRRQRLHPLGVSAWLLLQMLFLYELYFSLFNLFAGQATAHVVALLRINRQIYPFLPRLTVVPDAHFLWLQGAYSLLTTDPWHILPVVVTVLTVLAVYLALRRATPIGRDMRHRLRTILAASLTLLGVALLTLFAGLVYPVGVALSWGISMLFVAAWHTTLMARGP